jgi:uncharacterized cupredoxin-like copper-binding protein
MKHRLPAALLAALIAGAALPATAITALAGPGAHGHAHHHGHDEATAFGEPGDPAKPARTVEVAMRESDGAMAFTPAKLVVKRGEQVRFVLRNEGALDHEFVLATLADNLKHAEAMKKNPDMEHDDPNAKRLAPKAAAEILWKFTRAGTFDYSCLIPGHREAGMHGAIVVR